MIKLEFKKLGLVDKELFDKIFHDFPPLISEYTFTNLFIWRNSRIIEYALYEDGIIIIAEIDGKKYFMMPVGYSNHKNIYSFLFEYGAKYNLANSIIRIDEFCMNKIEELGFNITEDIDNSDYVYKTEDLAVLKGRKYSNKRNIIRKFYEEYYHKYWAFTGKCKDKCLTFTDKWFKDRINEDPTLKDEYDAINEFFTHIELFDIKGSVMCIDDKIAAFSFGEKLNKNTFVTHFEKADSTHVGVYQTINKLFAENEILGQYKYINREQDLGKEGLRKAKRSYYPVKMIKKYTITI